jgi:hypothetical protein
MSIFDFFQFKGNVEERLGELEKRTDKIERELSELHEKIERGLKTALDQALNLKRKTDEELRDLRANISAQMEVMEKVVQGELDDARRREVKQLLRRARGTRTRVDKLIAANQNLPPVA